ncbi:DUF3558 domain-containing protein [Nocardia aobensis]|uniref:DUF3558 domain-containing protein n=1 Tax=Nocardia aobensis TaxID=257277 RepID=A0ABW6PER4_9NOCA
MKLAPIAAVCAAAAFLAGCSSTTSGSPASPTTDKAAELWDPCTISDTTMQAAGMNPASKQNGIAGVGQHGWKICSWRGERFGLTVYSTAKGVDYFKAKPENTDFQPVTVAGRSGEQFRVNGTTRDLKCDMVFPDKQGVVQVTLLGWPSDYDQITDACGELTQAAAKLLPQMPE